MLTVLKDIKNNLNDGNVLMKDQFKVIVVIVVVVVVIIIIIVVVIVIVVVIIIDYIRCSYESLSY